MAIKIAINGAAGKMGKKVISLAASDERFEIAAALETPNHSLISEDSGIIAGVGENQIPITSYANDFDVLIDFSSPEGFLNGLDIALENKANFVSGTTGLKSEQFERLRNASSEIGIFYAANFSKGIAVLDILIQKAAELLNDADVEIIESHHRNKVDSPSGTAMSLANSLAKIKNLDFEKEIIFGRQGNVGPRKDSELCLHSIRAGGIIGEHKVLFAMPHENVILEHRAVDRKLFAAGALDAAEFVHDKLGLFSMNDLLNSI